MVDNWDFNSLVASLAAQCGLNDAPEFEQIIKIPQDQWFLLILQTSLCCPQSKETKARSDLHASLSQQNPNCQTVFTIQLPLPQPFLTDITCCLNMWRQLNC